MLPDPDAPIQTDRAAVLEGEFIAEFLGRSGYSTRSLHELPEDDARALMRDASVYASVRLAEVESRAHYIHEIHDVSRHSAS
jgi:hypothetical protein